MRYVYSEEYPIRYIKVKKNYIEGLGDTGDFAVVAGRMCHNRMKALSLGELRKCARSRVPNCQFLWSTCLLCVLLLTIIFLNKAPSDNPDIVTSFYIGRLVNKEKVQRFGSKR